MDSIEPLTDLAEAGTTGGASCFFLLNLRTICLNKSSDKTTKRERTCPMSSGLMRRKIGVTSAVEKVKGKDLTASTYW